MVGYSLSQTAYRESLDWTRLLLLLLLFCVYLTTALLIGNVARLPHNPLGDKGIFIGSLSVEKPYVFPPG